MLTKAQRSTRRKLCIMAALVLLAAAAYMTVDVNFGNAKLLAYSMRIRAPKLIVMLITAFAIGGASLVFQSIINNTIVTPCLLGMNSLYTLIHTAVVFCVGSGSVLAANANARLRRRPGADGHHGDAHLQLPVQKDEAQRALRAAGGHGADLVFLQRAIDDDAGDGPQ